MKTFTVGQLRERLAKLDASTPVRVWLPGTRISLVQVFSETEKGVVLIEGNVEPGSAFR